MEILMVVSVAVWLIGVIGFAIWRVGYPIRSVFNRKSPFSST